jgi:deoxyribodipyrimidine photolyase-like uncharacterized protein
LIDVGDDGPEPAGGQWNHDHHNCERPPKDGRTRPAITRHELDDIDRDVLDRLPDDTLGSDPNRTWPSPEPERFDRAVLPGFSGDATTTEMACVSNVIGQVDDSGYAHHIEWLMVLGNLALTAGFDPWAMTDWMWARFVDSAGWVMLPTVVGLALFAEGGRLDHVRRWPVGC